MRLPTSDRGRPRAQLAFTLAVAVLGWGALIATAVVRAGTYEPGGPALLAIFIGTILAARTMAFRLVPESVLSLDSAIFVAAAMCLGPVKAGWLVAIALTVDAAARRERELWYVLYFGGMTGAVLMGCALVTGVPPANAGELTVMGHVLAVGGLLLVAHYAIQGARSVLAGRPWRSYLRQMALPGILSEASLLPAAVVLVLLYHPDELLPFALVCATYLLVNFVFNRLSRASTNLRQRVRELEILDRTARKLSASLQLQELIETVARETLRAIPEAEAIALVHGERFVMDSYDRATDKFERRSVSREGGAIGEVLTSRAAKMLADQPDGVASWLGVPLYLYGDVGGVLAIQSRTAEAFTLAHQRLLESIGLQVAQALQNAHLYEMAMVDGLTGLFVRRYFDARIEEEIERARRYGQGFSVVMMDVDDFKALNDTHGHQVGDRVLRQVAACVKANMRGVDTASRYGGEEIALILPRTEMVSAYNQAERIRASIAAGRVADGDETVAVTASFGIAAYPESGATTAEELVKRADRALYRAKRTGKNRVELFWGDESGRIAALEATN
jgi:diguanylate cyclase (GGDEF)-like protein